MTMVYVGSTIHFMAYANLFICSMYGIVEQWDIVAQTWGQQPEIINVINGCYLCMLIDRSEGILLI